jgi:thioredoxin-like negative regulator of GroEL
MREILVFKMPNCAPCTQLEVVMKDFENVSFLQVMENVEKSQQFNIRKAPTVIVLEEGKELLRFTGYKTKEEIENLL